jgi:hypothetical protein
MGSRVWITEFATSKVEASPYAALASALAGHEIDLAAKPDVVAPAFQKTTAYIRIMSEVQCAIALVKDSSRPGDATRALNIILRPGHEEYFGVTGGGVLSLVLVEDVVEDPPLKINAGLPDA